MELILDPNSYGGNKVLEKVPWRWESAFSLKVGLKIVQNNLNKLVKRNS